MNDYFICPTVTSENELEFVEQINKVKSFTSRIHYDLMDGNFAPSKSPDIANIDLPDNIKADFHLMFENPEPYLDQLISKKANLVILHIESKFNHQQVISKLHNNNISSGIGILPSTQLTADSIQIISLFDHVLIFGGHLGYQGGEIDLSNTSKVKQIKKLLPNIQIGWDGGINDVNIKPLFDLGVSVFNAGGFIQFSIDPKSQYQHLIKALEG